MRISEMLYAIASWLESPDNEALLLAEYDENCLQVVAESCVEAAKLLKITAEAVDDIEPPEESKITPESIEDLAQIATAFDSSGDPALVKQAAVIDELLLTIASPPHALAEYKKLEDHRLEDLRKRYEQPTKDLQESNKIADSLKAVEKSPMMKTYRILEHPLSARTCPDHPGTMLYRSGDDWICPLDKKVYNFETGFELNNGDKIPGGTVSEQTTGTYTPFSGIFDSREERLGSNRP